MHEGASSGLRHGQFRALQAEMDYSCVVGMAKDAAALAQDGQHPAVIAAHVGFKPSNPALVGNAGQVPDEEWSNAGALVFVEHRQSHLGAPGIVRPDVTANADETLPAIAPQSRCEADVPNKVKLGETG